MISCLSTSVIPRNAWHMDSGASRQMTLLKLATSPKLHVVGNTERGGELVFLFMLFFLSQKHIYIWNTEIDS